jgi:uncharacterized protein YlxW (UPF0749 family)
MDLGLVNAFLAAEPANDTERLIQVNVRSLNENLNKLTGQASQLESSLKKHQEEVLRLGGALENQLSLAEFIAKQKGLQPLQPKAEEDKETASE